MILNDVADFRSWIYFKSISALNWILSISKTNGEDSDPSFSVEHSLLSSFPPALPHHHHHHFHYHFSGKIIGKILRTHKYPSHLFFQVKISHLFGGFCTFAWGYFYLNFNNDIHVIYKHWKWYLCVCIYGLFWWNYLLIGYMVCANDDYLRLIYGRKFRGFEL